MKYLFILILFFGCKLSTPNPPLSFKDVLKNAKEITFHDSLLLDFSSLPKESLDSVTGKKYWEIIYNNEKEMIHNADFYIAGKITSKKLNLLLFGIERASNNIERSRGISQEIFLIVLDKNGNYKDRQSVSEYWDIKENNKILNAEKFNSWLSKDFKLMNCSESRIVNDSIIFQDYYKFSYTSGQQITENGFSTVRVFELNLDSLNH